MFFKFRGDLEVQLQWRVT